MTYQEAITSVKNGNTVKRQGWTNRIVRQTTDSVGNSHITKSETVTVSADYLATQEDMYANDWTNA